MPGRSPESSNGIRIGDSFSQRGSHRLHRRETGRGIRCPAEPATRWGEHPMAGECRAA